jgi:hypothetical protein
MNGRVGMCEKCRKNPKNRNTRYCDDWWDDTPHGGYKGDRKLKEEHAERDRREKEIEERGGAM